MASDSAEPATRDITRLHGLLTAIIRPLRQILPSSGLLALVSLGGFVAEALLISLARPNLYATDRPTVLFGILFLAWFWLTIGWGLQIIGRLWLRQLTRAGRWGRYLWWLGLGAVAALVVCGYAVSWGLFFRSGRFANVETGRFVLFNFRHLWSYLVAAEPVHLVVGSLLVTTVCVGLPGLIRWCLERTRHVDRQRRAQVIGVWIALGLVTLVTWKQLPPNRSTLRQAARQHALKNALNPTFSLYVSHLESSNASPIQPTLDVNSLQPLSAARDYPAQRESTTEPPSIIFVAVESLRHDAIYQSHQGREILPNINRLTRNGLELTRAYAQSTHSDYADVCLVSSLYPLRTRRHHYYAPSDPWPVTRIYDLLKPLGYSTAIISSQNEAWGGMDHFLASEQLDLFYHPETSHAKTWVAPMDRGFSIEVEAGGLVAGKFPDAHTTDRAIAWINRQVHDDKPFFLSMNLQSSHFPYLMPDDVPRPFTPHKLAADISFVAYPKEETDTVRNAYYNAIHECDRQIGRLVAALKSMGRLDNTILVVTGENGEAFHECGQVTHASAPVEPVIHIACIVHAPRYVSPRVDNYPFQHVDLVPTVLGLAGLPTHPNFQGIDILAADRPPAETRRTFCHVLSSLAEADSILGGGRWKLTVDRRSGQATLYDVMDDPLETRDLITVQRERADSLRRQLEQWRRDQLAYYHFPSYYLHFFPPPPQ